MAMFLQSVGREPRSDPSQFRANGIVAAPSWRVGIEERRAHVARCTLPVGLISLAMINARHPAVAISIMRALETQRGSAIRARGAEVRGHVG